MEEYEKFIIRENKFERLPNLIPLMGIAFIIYATVEVFFYFQYFNFNILPFIDIAELLPLALFDFIITAIGILIFLMLCIAIAIYAPKKFHAPALYITIGFIVVVMVIDLLKSNYTAFIDRDMYLLTVMLSSVTIFSMKRILDRRPPSHFIVIIGLFFCLAIGNGIFRAYNKFYDVINSNHYLNTYIVVNNKDTVRSSYKNFYIGRCKGSFIFYNRATRGVDLYPAILVSHAYINSK